MSVEYLRNPEQLIGMPATEVANFVIQSLPQISEFKVVGYQPRLGWAEGYWNPLESKRPFLSKPPLLWPSYTQEPFERTLPRSVINDPELWNNLEKELKEVDIEEFVASVPTEKKYIYEVLKRWKPKDPKEISFYLAITSTVYLENGSERHIPMMDFSFRLTKERRLLVKKDLADRGDDHGLLLRSGASFHHFYGLRLLEKEEWRKWIRSWYWTLADNFYIGFSLFKGYSSLRLSSGPEKPEIPTAIEVL